MSRRDGDGLLAAVVVDLARITAEHWAEGDYEGAERLLEGALRIIGDDTFTDTKRDREADR